MCGSSPPNPPSLAFFRRPRPAATTPLVALCSGYEGFRECSAQRAAKQLLTEHLTARTQHTDIQRCTTRRAPSPRELCHTYRTVRWLTSTKHKAPSASAPSQAHPDSQGSFLFPSRRYYFKSSASGGPITRHASNRGIGALYTTVPTPIRIIKSVGIPAFLYRLVHVHGIDINTRHISPCAPAAAESCI